MEFSLLMSIYSGTQAQELEQCFHSVEQQTATPAEIVLVVDGPVSKEVEDCLALYAENLPIKLLRYRTNRGLGLALRDGLANCSYPIVARMDTDDICVPDRFEKEFKFLEEHPEVSLVGGTLRERYRWNGKQIIFDRRVPQDPRHIERFAKFRNPINHPTVMFRKQAIMEAGSYVSFDLLEDYHLFARLLSNGSLLANLNCVLVETEVDDVFFQRRGGLRYLYKEIALTSVFRKIRFHSWFESLIFILVRAPFRLIPTRARQILYPMALRQFNARV